MRRREGDDAEPLKQTKVMPVPVYRHLSSRRKGNEGASLLLDNRQPGSSAPGSASCWSCRWMLSTRAVKADRLCARIREAQTLARSRRRTGVLCGASVAASSLLHEGVEEEERRDASGNICAARGRLMSPSREHRVLFGLRWIRRRDAVWPVRCPDAVLRPHPTPPRLASSGVDHASCTSVPSDYHTLPRHLITMDPTHPVRPGTPLPPICEDTTPGSLHHSPSTCFSLRDMHLQHLCCRRGRVRPGRCERTAAVATVPASLAPIRDATDVRPRRRR